MRLSYSQHRQVERVYKQVERGVAKQVERVANQVAKQVAKEVAKLSQKLKVQQIEHLQVPTQWPWKSVKFTP